MAIPVITDHFQLQWAWQAPSGLPEDQFITTWYFRNDGIVGNPGPTMATMVKAFWDSVPTGQGASIITRMPSSIVEAQIKVYDLGQPTPRYPIHEETFVPTSVGNAGTPLPREVAVVQSYYGGQGPRKRGRNYIGPLASAVIDEDLQNVPRVEQLFQDVVAAAALDLRNSTENATWVQVSTTYGVASPVQGGWVDDAFDTQRRRGAAPSARTTWGDPAS